MPNWNPPPRNQSVCLTRLWCQILSSVDMCTFTCPWKKRDVMDRLLDWLLIQCVEPSLPPLILSLSLLHLSYTHRHTHISDLQHSASFMCDWQLVRVFGFINIPYFYFSMLLHHPTHQQIENFVRQCGDAHKYDTHTLVHNVSISTQFHSMIIKRNGRVGVWTECQLSKGVECHSAFFLQKMKTCLTC